MRRSVSVPLYVIAVVLVALALNLGRGFLMAQERAETLQPRRPLAHLQAGTADAVEIHATHGSDYLLVDFANVEAAAGARLALHQILEERSILRWLEPSAGSAAPLVLPLRGLREGEFGLRWAESGENAGPVEMDQPERDLAWIARFTLRRD